MEQKQEQQPDTTKPKRSSIRDFLSLGEVGRYFFRKKDPSRPVNINIRMMHGVNKLSIIIFLLALIYMLVKHLIL